MIEQALPIGETLPLQQWRNEAALSIFERVEGHSQRHTVTKWRNQAAPSILERVVPTVWKRVIGALRSYHAQLERHIGQGYSRAVIDDLIEDDELVRALMVLSDALKAFAQRHPILARIPAPPWMMVPREVWKDRMTRKRLKRAIAVMHQAMRSVRRLSLGSAESPTPASTDPVGLVYDPNVPTEITERVLAMFRSRFAYDLANAASRANAWSISDVQAALFDWADWVEHAMGLIASIPGASVPSLPHDQLLDLERVLARHRERQSRLAEQASDAARSLGISV